MSSSEKLSEPQYIAKDRGDGLLKYLVAREAQLPLADGYFVDTEYQPAADSFECDVRDSVADLASLRAFEDEDLYPTDY